MSRRVWGCDEAFGASLGDTAPSADLVVAMFQMRSLKADVEKGSMRTAVGHGLADPKRRGCSAYAGCASPLERPIEPSSSRSPPKFPAGSLELNGFSMYSELFRGTGDALSST